VSHHAGDGLRHRPAPANPGPDLFAWSGGGIVLLGERAADRWVVARGWRHGDRLSDVRRWSFADPRAFAGQVRRLAREATGNPVAAAGAGTEAIAWVQAGGASAR
jgi:hypothetical protein